MFLGYAQNHTDVTYHMLNLCTECILLSHNLIWFKKTYGECVSRRENNKADSYILKNEGGYYKWSHVKNDPVNNEVKTKNVKTKENVGTKQYSNREEAVQNIFKRVSFAKQENQVKQFHEDIDKNVLRALKKLDTSYNPDSINYINKKFKDMILEEEKALIHQEHSYFSVLS